MLRTLVFLFVSLVLLSCGKSGGGGGSGSDAGAIVGDRVQMQEAGAASPLPPAALNFAVNLHLDNFNSVQEDKVLAAAELIKKVVASEKFRTAILNHRFKGKRAFNDNAGLSNAQIYAKILEGAEELRPQIDNEMDLDLEVYRDNNNTVGYTYPSELRVWMNEKYLNKNPPHKVTTNMMHEWLHKLGFKHDVKDTPTRRYSVPYAVGYIVARLAAQVD